jgi:hypothetical protein
MENLFEQIKKVNNVTVYHRTGASYNNNTFILNSIAKNFIPSTGDRYGVGFYSNYNIKSSLDNMSYKTHFYGKIILKAKIESLSDFLILDYKVAKILYGRNYSIIKQLKRIDLDFLNNNEKLIYDFHRKLEAQYIEESISSEVAYELKDLTKVKGFIFTTDNDGNVLFVRKNYINELVSFKSFSIDNGRKWLNIDLLDTFIAFLKLKLKNLISDRHITKLKKIFDL